MKINFIAPGLFKSGGMRVIYEYCVRLSRRGHEVCLYYPMLPYDLNKYIFNLYRLKVLYWQINTSLNHKKFFNFFKNKGFNVKRVPYISNKFIEDADFIFATSWPTAFSVFKLKNSKGKKLYFVQDYEAWMSNVDLVDKSYKLGIPIITTCNYLKKLLWDKFNVDSKVIYFGIDFDIFYNNEKQINKEKTILFIPHGLERKNTPFALEIIKKLKEINSNYKIKSFSTHVYPNLPDYIEFHLNPTENKIRELYSNSDLFLYTSNHEGFGLPPAEAMACKCLACSTCVGAIPEYIQDEVSGILIFNNNLEEICSKIINVMEDDNKLLRCSINGFENVRNFFDWDNSVDELELFLNKNKN